MKPETSTPRSLLGLEMAKAKQKDTETIGRATSSSFSDKEKLTEYPDRVFILPAFNPEQVEIISSESVKNMKRISSPVQKSGMCMHIYYFSIPPLRCSVGSENSKMYGALSLPDSRDPDATGAENNITPSKQQQQQLPLQNQEKQRESSPALSPDVPSDTQPERKRHMIACSFESGHVGIYDLQRENWIAFEHFHTDPALSLCMDATGRRGASGSAGSTIIAFTLVGYETGTVSKEEIMREESGCGDTLYMRKEKDLPTGDQGGIQWLGIRARRPALLISGGWDQTIRLYHWKTLEPLSALRFHRGGVNGVALHEESGVMVSGAGDGVIAVWNQI